MHSALLEELVDVRRRDTEVSVPAFRRHRLRTPVALEERPGETADSGEIAGPWVDPGDTMSAASAIDVLLREAIVRRNHRIEKREQPAFTGCIPIDWARSNDRQLSLVRVARGVLRVGPSAGNARISLGIDGLAFTLHVPQGGAPAEAIAARLERHYHVEIVQESDGHALVILKAPRSHT